MSGRKACPKINLELVWFFLIFLYGMIRMGPVTTQTVSVTPLTLVSLTSEHVATPTFARITPTSLTTPTATVLITPTPTASLTATAISTKTPYPIYITYITKEDILNGTVWLEIPKIKVKTQIELAEIVNTKTGPSFDLPKEKPKWVPDWSREIGLSGISLIYGHRQWGRFPKVFSDLDRLETHDKVIIISTRNRFTYRVIEKIVINPDKVWELIVELDQQAKEKGKSQLALLTCTPWGTNLQRLIVLSELEEVNCVFQSCGDYTSME